jgi:RHS repeat-associated protein
LHYNTNGTLDYAVDRAGNRTSYSYDANGNLTGIAYPAPVGAETFTMDALSRPQKFVDGKGQTTTYEYDALDALTKVVAKTASGTATAVSYTYDADGNQIQRDDPTGTATFSYDKKNRLTTQTLPGPKTTTYGYDAADNLTSVADSGGTVTYAYDAAGRLSSITEPGAAAPTTFGYNASGARTSTSYPNGVTIGAAYQKDAAGNDGGKLKSLTATNAAGTTLQSFGYSYLKGGADTDLRQSVTDKAGSVTSYTYTALNRLFEARTVNAAGAQTDDRKYGYDPMANIISQNINGTTTTLTYNGANQLVSDGSKTYSYDANGNQTGDSANGLGFAYNALNQTTSITPATGSPVALSYRSTGQFDRSALNATSFTSNELGVSSSTFNGATAYYVREPGGQIVSERAGTSTYYYLYDALGSITGLTDKNGALVNTYSYDPYGRTLSATGTVGNPWRFTGQLLDNATGLYKIGARYYNQALGRWTQQDPVLVHDAAGQDNRYAYVGADPVNWTDPSGLCIIFSCKTWDKIGSSGLHLAKGLYTLGETASMAGLTLTVSRILCPVSLSVPTVAPMCVTVIGTGGTATVILGKHAIEEFGEIGR